MVKLFEIVYMDSQGYKQQQKNCKLNKFVYETSKQWLCKFSLTLQQHNFTSSKYDYSLFFYGSGSSLVIFSCLCGWHHLTTSNSFYVNNIGFLVPNKDL